MSVEALPTIEQVYTAVVRQICGEMGISTATILSTGNRSKRASTARRAITERLHKEGFSLRSIARLLKMSESSIHYHHYPKMRERSIARRKAHHEAARA